MIGTFFINIWLFYGIQLSRMHLYIFMFQRISQHIKFLKLWMCRISKSIIKIFVYPLYR